MLINKDELYAGIDNQLFANGINYALTFCVILMIVFFISGIITKPIKTFTEHVNNISSGRSIDPIYINTKDEIGTLAQSFNKMLKVLTTKEETDSAVAAKDQFVAAVYHELKTPMTAVIRWAQLAKTVNEDLRVSECLSKIELASHRLVALVNEILDFSNLQSGNIVLDKEEFELDSVIFAVENMFMKSIAEKQLRYTRHIDHDVPRRLIGSPVRVKQLLNYYFNNAIKFTNIGEIKFSVEYVLCRPNGAIIKFNVSDTGIGIEADKKEKMFKQFLQAEGSPSKKYRGMGISLAKCKKLAELMGGEVSFESEWGKGSTFSFTAVFEVPAGVNS